jgi:hypothetical protein
MIIDRVACAAVVFSVVVAILGPPDAHAQSRGTMGDCLAFTDHLDAPVLVLVQSTNGVAPIGSMSWMQLHQNGYIEWPWIIQPGETQVLLVKRYDNSTSYLVSQNGDFNVMVLPIHPSPDQQTAVQIFSWPFPKVNWFFHPEMIEGGNCKGAWVGSVGS